MSQRKTKKILTRRDTGGARQSAVSLSWLLLLVPLWTSSITSPGFWRGALVAVALSPPLHPQQWQMSRTQQCVKRERARVGTCRHQAFIFPHRFPIPSFVLSSSWEDDDVGRETPTTTDEDTTVGSEVEKDLWGQRKKRAVAATSIAPSMDELRALQASRSRSAAATTKGEMATEQQQQKQTLAEERDLFIPIFSLVSLAGLFGAYGYEMMRLASRGELYLPWN